MLLRSALATGLMGLVLGIFLVALPDLDAIVLGLTGVILGACVYLGAALLLGVQEIRVAFALLARRRSLS
jgi:hypothetical protein